MSLSTRHSDSAAHRREIVNEITRLTRLLEHHQITVVVTAYTIEEYDVILVDDDTAAGVVTLTLLSAENGEGRPLWIKKIGSTANVVIDGKGSETIDGSLTKTLSSQYESTILVSDGSNWHVF